MEMVNPKLRIVASSYYRPKSKKKRKRSFIGPFIGDDAHFISEEAQFIGVADGVGGWWDRGIDPGEYSRDLMRHAADFVESSRAAAEDVGPMRVLKEAFNKTTAEGSSTACIIRLDGNRLMAANVGDSGFMVVRNGKTLFKSNIQQIGFNKPYQLGRGANADTPEVAEETVVLVESGDVVVAGTDGLFDNLYSVVVEELVQRYLKKRSSPAKMAEGLGKAARARCREKNPSSPFQDAAAAAGKRCSHAKNDDITVVVAFINEEPTL